MNKLMTAMVLTVFLVSCGERGGDPKPIPNVFTPDRICIEGERDACARDNVRGKKFRVQSGQTRFVMRHETLKYWEFETSRAIQNSYVGANQRDDCPLHFPTGLKSIRLTNDGMYLSSDGLEEGPYILENEMRGGRPYGMWKMVYNDYGVQHVKLFLIKSNKTIKYINACELRQ